MSGEEMIVAVIAITGGLTFTTIVFVKIVGLIKAWINRDGSEVTAEDYKKLAGAFVKHKKDAERRIENLEAIIAGEDPEPSVRPANESPQVKATSPDIKMDDQPPPGDQQSRTDSSLRNMLRD